MQSLKSLLKNERAAELAEKIIPGSIHSWILNKYLDWLKSIYPGGSQKFYESFGQANQEREILKNALEKCPSDADQLEEWLSLITDPEMGLLKYKKSNLEAVNNLWEEENSIHQNKAKVIIYLVLESFLFEKINNILEVKTSELQTELDENEYPQVAQFVSGYQKNIEQIQLANSVLCPIIENICIECLKSPLVKENTKKDLERVKEKIKELKNKNYKQTIEKLVKNIYLTKVQQILQELDNYLVKKKLKYEETGNNYREKIKEQESGILSR